MIENIKTVRHSLSLRGAVVGLAVLTLSSCGVYTKYERPTVDATGLVRDTLSAMDTLAVSDTASFGNLPWREVFTDPQLQGYISQALANNANMLNAIENVKIAEAQLKSSKLSFLPSFYFSPQGTLSSWDGGAAYKTYSFPVQASWNVDLFGNLLNAKRAAQVTLLQTKDYQLSVQTQLVSGVANSYYSLLMLDKQKEILDSMEVLLQQTYDMMVSMKKLGQTNETAVQSAKASLLSVQASNVDMQRQIREAENSLCILLGERPQYISRGDLYEQKLPENFSTGIAINMLNNRPDVHAAEMSLASCFYNVNQARSRFYPSLSISGSGAFTNSSGSAIVNPGKILLSAVASLTQPIFANGQLVAGLKVAKAQQEQAYNTWQNTVLQAGAEVSNALVLYNASAKKSALDGEQAEVLKKNVEYTQKLFHLGSSTYLEVITAESNYLNAQTSKITDDFNKMQAVVNLYQALGGGVK